MKPKIALVRGKFLNQYEMQTFEKLTDRYSITAFGSHTSFHSNFTFPVKTLVSPIDFPDFPYKMQLVNRLCVDAHYLFGLENELKGFDIAHTAETYYHYTQQCLNAKKRGYIKKVVVTVLENIAHNNEGIWGRKHFKERARNEADILIALTQKTKSALVKEGADERKIRVIGSGIDTQRFYPVERNSSELTILFVGRLEWYKGIFNLVDAIRILAQDREIQKQFKVIVAGEGGQKREMVQKERQLGLERIFIHKTAEYGSIHKIYQDADIFVAPSIDTDTWQEQYGYMLLEAQASGLPIITTRAGSIPEVVGDGGILVDQNNPKQIYHALKQLIQDKQKRVEYGKAARNRAVTVHDATVTAKKIATVYESIL